MRSSLQQRRQGLYDIHDDTTALACKACHACIASRDSLVFKEGFRGYSGKAALFTQASDVMLKPPSIMLMDTGAHTIQEASCAACNSYIGWKIVRAHETPEKWKEGHYLLELWQMEKYSEADQQGRPDVPDLMAKMAIGHRRSVTDPHTTRGRPLGPRSLTPSLKNRDRTISILSHA